MENERLETASEATPAPADPGISAWPFYGYAPGSYFLKCADCDEQKEAAKRSIRCLECAVIASKKAEQLATPAPSNGLKQFGVIFQNGETRHFEASRMTRDDDWIVLWNGDEQIAHFCRPAGAGAQ